MSSVETRFNKMACDLHRVQLTTLVRELSKIGTVNVNQTKNSNVTNMKIIDTHKYIICGSVIVDNIQFDITITHTGQHITVKEVKESSSSSSTNHKCDISTSIICDKNTDCKITFDYVMDHCSLVQILNDIYSTFIKGTLKKFVIPSSKVEYILVESKPIESSLPSTEGMFSAYAAYVASMPKVHSSIKKSAWDD